MPSRDPDKRPKGLRTLSALKANGFRSKKNQSAPPSPQDDVVDVPDYLAADTIPSIPHNKQLPPPPPPPLNHVQRREVPPGTWPRKESLAATNGNGISMGIDDGPMSAVNRMNGGSLGRMDVNEAPVERFYGTVDRTTNDAPMDRMPMHNGADRMPMETIPRNHALMDRFPMPNAPMDRMPVGTLPRNDALNEASLRTPRPPSPTIRPTPNDIPMNQVPRNSIQAATVPHAPKPIRPPSIPVVDRIPSDDSIPRAGPDGVIDTNVAGSDNEPTPTTSHENTAWMPLDVEPVAAPLTHIHFDCYQEHRSMPVAQNVWYPVPCMACHKYDQEIRHRCVFCCLRICVGCFQSLQKCQRRSLRQLMASIES